MAEPLLAEPSNREDANFSPQSSNDGLNASDDEYFPGGHGRKRNRRR